MGVWIAVGAGVLALLLFVYGVFRRFTRCSWLSWQVLILFAVSCLFKLMPAGGSAAANAVLPPVILFAAAALVLAVGGWTRHGFLAYKKRPPAFIRFCNRLLGGLTAVLNCAVFFAAIALPVFVALPLFGVQIADLSALYESAVWQNVLAGHALDLLTVSACLLAVRCGYRVGLLRSLWAILTILLCFGAAVLSVVLTVQASVFAGWAASFAARLPSLGAYASVVGKAIMAGIIFVVLLIVILVLSALINLLMKKLRTPDVLRAIDGALLALVFGAIFFAFAFALDLGVYFLAHGGMENAFGALAGAAGSAGSAAEGALGAVAAFMQKVEALFLSAPLSARLYAYNPFLLLFG